MRVLHVHRHGNNQGPVKLPDDKPGVHQAATRDFLERPRERNGLRLAKHPILQTAGNIELLHRYAPATAVYWRVPETRRHVQG